MVNRRRALRVGQCTRVCYGMNKQVVVRPAIDDHVWVVCVRDEGDGSGKLSCWDPLIKICIGIQRRKLENNRV